MPLFYEKLAPWEQRKEHYSMIQLGKDVKEQTEVLNQQTKAMIAAQLASAKAVIASQERIAEGIDAVAYGVERVEQGIFELKSAFEWGISEVVWQIEQNRTVLKDILEILMAPLDTQARERRKRAEEAYANGWIEDAEEEFLASEQLNRFDFSIHMSLGMIYLFHIIDKRKALAYFEKAAKYARPKSSFHVSYALLYKALIHFDMGNAEEAEQASSEAVELSPDFAEALYQNAQYNAQLSNVKKSVANLGKAIRSDRLYCLKADKDELFDPIRKDVDALLERLRNEEGKKAADSLAKLSEKQKALVPVVVDLSKEKFIDASPFAEFSNEAERDLKTANAKALRNSYFDFREVNDNLAPTIRTRQADLVSDLQKTLEEIVQIGENNLAEATKERDEKSRKLGDSLVGMLFLAFIVQYFITYIIYFNHYVLPMQGNITSSTTLAITIIGLPFYALPVIGRLGGIQLLFNFLTNTGAQWERMAGFWSVLCFVAAIARYYYLQKSLKNKTKEEVSKQGSLQQRASIYLTRLKAF